MNNGRVASPVRLLIYAAVRDPSMLQQGFYAAEADGLRAHPMVAKVDLTNRLDVVARASYDGLVSFFYSYSAVTAMIARLRGRPAVVTGGAEQIFPAFAPSRLQYAARVMAFRATLLSASRILATSSSDIEQMCKLAGAGRSKLQLSYHGAASVDRLGGVPPFGARPEGSMVTICGLDTPANIKRKGMPKAIQLLARVREECPQAHLTIIGRTTCRAAVEEMADAAGVANALTYAGYVTEDEKIDLLRSNRYYVQLSTYEGFGVGALEALSQGCLVIHSGNGGLADTVGSFGYVLPREAVGSFSLSDLPEYHGAANDGLLPHLEAFRPSTRADAILNGLFENSSLYRGPA